MVVACERWFSLRVAVLSSLFIGSVALAAVLISQDAGKGVLSTNVSINQGFKLSYHSAINNYIVKRRKRSSRRPTILEEKINL